MIRFNELTERTADAVTAVLLGSLLAGLFAFLAPSI